MRRTNSLQRRLGLGLTLAVTLLWLGATLSAGLVIRHELNEAFDSTLVETAQRLLPLAVVALKFHQGELDDDGIDVIPVHDESLIYVVRDAQGRLLLHSHDADVSIFPHRPGEGFATTADYRFYGEYTREEGVYIEVAQPLIQRREAASDALVALVYPLAILIPLSLVVIWFILRLNLRGIVDYQDAIKARGPGDLSPVAAKRLPAEITPIAEAVNQLLDRLRRVLESERAFTANSAHELRTPLAEMLAQVQRLRVEAPEGPLRERVLKIEHSLRGLSRLSEKLMQLAKAEGGGVLAARAGDITPVVLHVVEDFKRKYEGDIELQLPVPTSVLSVIDPDALAILLRNLLENALKHGTVDEPVTVVLSASAELRVANHCPVVTPDQLRGLTERFVRGPTKAAGSGLGLAIVAAIAEGAGASLTLLSPASQFSDGFEVRLQLPR